MRGTLGVRGIATRTRAASALVCLLGLAVSCRSAKSPDDPFVGTWVVRADENPIFTVVVARRAGALGATLTTPNWQTRDGVTFTVQGTGAGTSEATAVIVRGPHHLHLRIDNPKNPTDTSEFDLALNDAQSGEMQYVGVPFPAWPLRKVPPNELPMPQVEWQAGRLYTIDMPAPPPNTEMAAIYDADQQDR